MASIRIRTALHIALTAALNDDTGMVRALDLYAPVSAKRMVHFHAALGVA
jgi:hypothetical protein